MIALPQIVVGVAVMCGLSGILALLLLLAEYFFADYGECEISVNKGERTFSTKGGNTLLRSLAEAKLFLPSGCGGRGSCGTCKCRVVSGGGPLLPTEIPYLNRSEIETNVRLSCQIKVKENIEVAVAEELLSVREFKAVVERMTDLTNDIKGLRIALPEGETVKFKAGQFVNLISPPYADIKEPTSRAYSISSSPSDDRAVELIIRLVPNGIVTTYVFENLHEGDRIDLIGPYGDFFLRESSREIVFIAGGSGLAPIKSIVLDMIEKKISNRPAKFFFGAVRAADLYYVDEFRKIEEANPWFKFIPALSGDENPHNFEKGLVTDVVARHYDEMSNHEAYLCGSPGMINACIKVLAGQGLPENLIFYDKFS